MTKMNMTKHCAIDRIDRVMFIATYIGWGDPYVKVHNTETGHIEVLTNSGVVLIKSEDETTLITTYPATIEKAVALCAQYGMRCPANISKRIRKNQDTMRKMGYNL